MIENSRVDRLLRLLKISSKTRILAQEIVPLINNIPLNDNGTFYVINRLLELVDGIIYTDNITLLELAQNNFEFLDNLRTITLKLRNQNLITKTQFDLLLARIDRLIVEMNLFPTLNKELASDEVLQRKRTDDKFTESPRVIVK